MSQEARELEPGITVAPATHLDVLCMLAIGLRHSDVEELKSLTPSSVRDVLRDSLDKSYRAFTVHAGGNPVLMYGVAVLPTGDPNHLIGTPWLLATDGFDSLHRPFLRHGK